MQEVGKVVEVLSEKNMVKVRFERHSSCSSCGMCMFKKEDTYVDMQVENTLSLQLGDTATVCVKDSVVIQSAIIAYFIPILFAAVGLIIGLFLKNELIQLAICLGMLVVGYIIIIILDRKFKLTHKLKPVLIEKMEDEKNG